MRLAARADSISFTVIFPIWWNSVSLKGGSYLVPPRNIANVLTKSIAGPTRTATSRERNKRAFILYPDSAVSLAKGSAGHSMTVVTKH